MILAIRWMGELEVEGREDAERMVHAFASREPVDVNGRKCLVVAVQPPDDRNGRILMRVDVEEVVD